MCAGSHYVRGAPLPYLSPRRLPHRSAYPHGHYQLAICSPLACAPSAVRGWGGRGVGGRGVGCDPVVLTRARRRRAPCCLLRCRLLKCSWLVDEERSNKWLLQMPYEQAADGWGPGRGGHFYVMRRCQELPEEAFWHGHDAVQRLQQDDPERPKREVLVLSHPWRLRKVGAPDVSIQRHPAPTSPASLVRPLTPACPRCALCAVCCALCAVRCALCEVFV